MEEEGTIAPQGTETYEHMTETERNQERQDKSTNATYSNMTTNRDFFHWKLTLSADIRDIDKFDICRFCQDLATRPPPVMETCPGITETKRKQKMEPNFNNNGPMIHLQQHELDTRDKHMKFIPDQPRVTMVSLWCIPLEMEETAVDENLQRFGDIKSRYKSKNNQFGQIINTGVHVYSIVLKNTIPKTSTISSSSSSFV